MMERLITMEEALKEFREKYERKDRVREDAKDTYDINAPRDISGILEEKYARQQEQKEDGEHSPFIQFSNSKNTGKSVGNKSNLFRIMLIQAVICVLAGLTLLIMNFAAPELFTQVMGYIKARFFMI